jgi:large subunit ribosomal protein L15
MATSAHTIQANTKSKRIKKRVGRGNGSGKGTYASRGLKGQRSRSGGKGGLKRRGFRAALQKVPKLRGFKSIKPKKELVTLATLDRICVDGDVVSPAFLKKKGVVDRPAFGVKVVSFGTLEKKITLKGCLASKTALEAVEKVGGTLEF